MALQDIVQQTVTGAGLDLVEIERLAGGLLRITIDCPLVAGTPEQSVTVEDCETVTRQLQFALEVEQIEYRRLEVSSPGIDRLLRGPGDLERFVDSVVDVTLKQPIGDAASGLVNANQKKFRGALERGDAGGWRVVWRDEPATKPGQRVSKKREPAPLQALDFVWDDVREARLAPIVDFKGRRGVADQGAAELGALDESAPAELGSEPNNE
ncbi:MAG: ribosome maturation factor RimP [Burkholderiaceae bacterium]